MGEHHLKQGAFCVSSEIGKLRRVMLHRPGKELARLTIDNKDELLFDDILWVEEAQKEHDAFADVLRDCGVEVVYFANCLAQVIRDKNIRASLLDEVLALEALDLPLASSLKDVLMDLEPADLAEILIAGITKKETLKISGDVSSLVLHSAGENDFFIRPLPNLYFQRDPYSFVNNGVIVSVMHYPARRREPLYARYIFEYHPYFEKVSVYFGNEARDTYPYNIEGGDFHVFSPTCVAVGVSERTLAGTVQIVGHRLAKHAGVKTVLAVEIPRRRACMHLDTVFTMVDRDAFCIYPGVQKEMRIWALQYDENGEIISVDEHHDIVDSLKAALGLDKVRLIETGGGDPIAAARDQWNDGTNTLSIAPGAVVTYRRNVISNEVLRENGVKVIEIKGAELGRGRGGPRCMSMPLLRDEI